MSVALTESSNSLPTPCAILVRHGNTFDPGDTVVSVGGKQDFALSRSGLAQLKPLETKLRGIIGDREFQVFSSPLKRALQTAACLGATPTIVECLRELDVGRWGGLTNEAIESNPTDREALRRWNEWGELPAVFNADLDKINAELSAFLSSLHSVPLSITFTHGGILRLIGMLLSGTPGPWKVATTGICVLEPVQYFAPKSGSLTCGWQIKVWGDLP